MLRIKKTLSDSELRCANGGLAVGNRVDGADSGIRRCPGKNEREFRRKPVLDKGGQAGYAIDV